MLKVFDLPTHINDEPTIRIINKETARGLIKEASDSRIEAFASKLKSSPDKIYVHILAMTAGEYYGANLNLDYFPEDNLIRSHQTFVSNPAHLFWHHQNKDPKKSFGKIIYSIYNPRMHRVELIGELERAKAPDIAARIERGDYPATSMACKVKSDTCSICGNVASTRQKYCSHLRNELGRIYPDGKRVYAINEEPLSFHDLSYVMKGADPVSSFLQKLASHGDIVGSAEKAEMLGMSDPVEKRSAFRKLSELIKEIEDGGHIVGSSDNLQTLLDQVKDPEEKLIDKLVAHNLKDVFTTFGHMGISPSLGFLSELIGRKLHGPALRGVGKLVVEHLESKGVQEDVESLEKLFEGDDVGVPRQEIAILVAPHLHDSSMLPTFVEKRAGTVFGTNVGYIGNGPTIEPTLDEKVKAQAASMPESSISKIESALSNNKLNIYSELVRLGVSAILAKWYISSVIREKMEEARLKDNSGIKIVLVKQASDYRSTYYLSMADTARCVKTYVKASKN